MLSSAVCKSLVPLKSGKNTMLSSAVCKSLVPLKSGKNTERAFLPLGKDAERVPIARTHSVGRKQWEDYNW
ncbi:hypothetical protein V6N13_119353 [Hibiscus sabdariffa]